MFNERARFRLHHPVGSIPNLACAPNAEPNDRLAARVAAAFRHAGTVSDTGAVWEPLIRGNQKRMENWLAHCDVAPLAADLAALGRSEAAQGFFGGAGQHRKCDADPTFAQLLAAWTYDTVFDRELSAARLAIPR